jgi:hypothetical protein
VRRTLFNLVASVSLVLIAVTAGAWVRSYWRSDGVSVVSEGGRQSISWKQGALRYFSSENAPGATMQPRWMAFSLPPDLLDSGGMRHFAGFRYGTKFPFNGAEVAVPFWFVVLILTVPLTRAVPTSWRLCAWLPGLLLATGCAVLWYRAGHTTEWWWWARPDGSAYFAVSTVGRLRLAVQRSAVPAPPGYAFDASTWSQLLTVQSTNGAVVNVELFDPYRIDRGTMGFGWTAYDAPPPAGLASAPRAAVEFRCLAIPYWFLTTFAALPTAVGVIRSVRAGRRKRRGLCPTCGYDCRGPAVGTLLPRCPECGTDLTSPKRTATDDQREEPVARDVEG